MFHELSSLSAIKETLKVGLANGDRCPRRFVGTPTMVSHSRNHLRKGCLTLHPWVHNLLLLRWSSLSTEVRTRKAGTALAGGLPDIQAYPLSSKSALVEVGLCLVDAMLGDAPRTGVARPIAADPLASTIPSLSGAILCNSYPSFHVLRWISSCCWRYIGSS